MFGSTRKPGRLAQWNGRTRSSRCDAVDWRSLLQRYTVIRAAVVVVSCIALAWIVSGHSIPFPYRYGQTFPRDLRARVAFDAINEAETIRNRERSDDAADAAGVARLPVPPVAHRYPAGLVIVRRETPVSADELVLLRAEHRAYVRSLPKIRLWARSLAVLAVVGLLGVTVSVYSVRFQPGLSGSLRKITGVSFLLVGTVWLAVALDSAPWHAAALPLAITAMVLTIAYNPPFALFMSVCLSILVAMSRGHDLSPFLIHLGGLTTAVLGLRQVRTRTRPVEVGMLCGAAFAVMTFATDTLTGQTLKFTFVDAGRNCLAGIFAGFVLTGSLPLIERCFGVVTDVSLLELSDSSHPLLQELLRRAPGTYTHSMTVATLAESAADAIGANTLLTRVGCYYHDIGKMLKPHYFIENQAGSNAHAALEPTLSTLVIVGHVKDGAALAEQYRLPRPIVDFICQHHGTTLVEYFYREALRLQGGSVSPEALERGFRYPGPKPQSREAGILMLADAAESASRSLRSPTPGAVRKLVHDLTMKRLLDGQFDESGLTLTELRAIEDALAKGLTAVYHVRIAYPEPDRKAG